MVVKGVDKTELSVLKIFFGYIVYHNACRAIPCILRSICHAFLAQAHFFPLDSLFDSGASGVQSLLMMKNNLHCSLCLQMDSGQGDLGTLANVVTSLANLSESLNENLNNGDTPDSHHEDQSASEITRSVCRTKRRLLRVCCKCVLLHFNRSF